MNTGSSMQIKMTSNQQKHAKFQGQSLLEMALVLPLLLVLIISAIEFGRLFYTKVVITNAAREGAYYLTTHISDYNVGTGTAPNTVSAAQAEANNSGISAITVGITSKNCCIQGVYSMEITVGTNVHDLIILGFLGNVFSLTATTHNEFPVSSSVEMMVQ
jgi:Flp pilus assembly protein TadG